MSNAVSEFRRCFSVGRFRCEVTAQLVNGKLISLQTAWSPCQPTRLHPILFREYRQKRNRTYTALAEQVGGPVVIVDRDGALAVHPDGSVEMIFAEEDQS